MRWIKSIWVIGLCALTSAGYAQGDYLQVREGLSLYYEDTGTGQPLVFIPGWTMTAAFFQKQKAHFQDTHRFISYDPRSQGRSSKVVENNTYAHHASDLRHLLETLDLEDVVLVGWSSGCLTMYAYLQQYGTDRIDRLVFIDEPPKWIGDTTSEWVYGTFEDYKGSLRGLLTTRRQDAYGVVDWMLADPVDAVTRTWMVDEMMKTPSHAALSLYVDGMIADYTDVVQGLGSDVSTLFLMRESWYEAGRRWLNTTAPLAKTERLSSHAMFWENPRTFNELLERFLASR